MASPNFEHDEEDEKTASKYKPSQQKALPAKPPIRPGSLLRGAAS